VDRRDHEAELNLTPDENLPAVNGHNSMVEWFDEEKKVSVVENEKICEYTTNMHLVRESVYLQNLVQKACRGANQYLEAKFVEPNC